MKSKRPSVKSRDPNAVARSVVEQATGPRPRGEVQLIRKADEAAWDELAADLAKGPPGEAQPEPAKRARRSGRNRKRT